MAEMRVLMATTDYERNRTFYRDVLRFPVQEEWDAPDGRGTLFATGAGVIEVIEDSAHHPAEAPRGVSVAIEVANVDALHERVVAAGVALTDPIGDRQWGHRNFAIQDPSGLPLIFFQVLDGDVAG